jgi:hypothetical protein
LFSLDGVIQPERNRPVGSAGTALTLFGVCSVLLGIAMIALYFAARHGLHSLSAWRTSVGASFFILTGIFTAFGYRWSAVALDVGLFAVAAWLTVGSILHVPFPWMLINFFFAALLCLPSLATFGAWRQLR